MQHAAIFSCGDFCICLLCLREREFIQECHHAVELGVVLMQTRQIHLRQLDRGHLLRLEQLRQVRNRQEGGIFQTAGTLERQDLAEAHRGALPIHFHSRYQWAEVKRWRHIVRDLHSVQRRDAAAVLGHGLQHRRKFYVGKFKTGEGRGRFQRRRSNLLRSLGFHFCP